MKRFCFLIVSAFVSIFTFAQNVTYSKGLYDSYGNQYIKTTVQNTSNKTVVGFKFLIEYDYPSMNDIRRYEGTYVQVNISPKSSKTFTYYPPKNTYKAIRQYLCKVVYADGTYKDY